MGIFGNSLLRKPMLSRELMAAQQPPMMSRELMAQQRGPKASLGGYDRNAAMMGQSGFAPMNQATPQKKPGFFSKGGAFFDVLGAFGDAFSDNGPVYAQQKAQRSRLMQEAQMAEQKRMQDREDFLFQEGYKRANPMPTNDKLTQYMRNAGIDPASDQGKAMYAAAATNEAYPERAVPYTDEYGNSGLRFIRSGMPPQQGGIQEGATATNPQTGEKIVFRNGAWQPMGGGVGNGTNGF